MYCFSVESERKKKEKKTNFKLNYKFTITYMSYTAADRQFDVNHCLL